MNPSIDVAPEDLQTIIEITKRIIPSCKIAAFGSRVTGKARKHSDLDLVILTDETLNFDTYAALKTAFSESDLPFKVDVVDWADIDNNFREVIAKQMVMLPQE